MTKAGKIVAAPEDLAAPVTIPVEAYISSDYIKLERDNIWRKSWLQAGRLEDIPEVGNYLTFDVMDDSILVVRVKEGTDPGAIKAYWNVCSHRGRRLVDTPAGQRNARGKKMKFVCGFHAWTFELDGRCSFIEHQDDWQGKLTDDRTRLGAVQADTWGGWVWINMDPAAGPLREYLEPAAGLLDPYQLENMRCRWRKWVVFDCNWKVAMEAFNETYHVAGTHPEFMAFGQFRGWGRNQGFHSNIGYDAPKGQEEDAGKLRLGIGDARISTAEMQDFTWENANTNTTMTLIEAARRLKDELPEGTPPAEVSKHWITTARADDAKRGVIWPTVTPEQTLAAGTAWQIFPNFQIGHAVNNMLCYMARPYGNDPDKCIFEGAVYELYPEGEAPETEWTYTQPHEWPPVLQQDFANMAMVQQGMKSGGFRGTLPNPYMERAIASLHYNLALATGTGTPRVLE
jgi:phenylpropionate dioxygenase-like ring-hydroxylating dioxygenase large terminal subunit